jgi:hypothetical protein
MKPTAAWSFGGHLREPARQVRHDGLPRSWREADPACDLGDRPSAANAAIGQRVDDAELDTGRFDGGHGQALT